LKGLPVAEADICVVLISEGQHWD